MSRATSLVAVAQQVSISAGVAIGALAVDLTLRARGRTRMEITAADFQPAYHRDRPDRGVARCSSSPACRTTPAPSSRNARRHRRPTPTDATDQKL